MLEFPVSGELAQYVPTGAPGAAICPSCLALEPDDDPPADRPRWDEISEPFPTEDEAAVPMALAIGLLTSLALYRSDIDALFDHVEEAGVDPMLVLEGLAESPEIDSSIDLAGRKRQLEQLLE
jgi:hypothetical protein